MEYIWIQCSVEVLSHFEVVAVLIRWSVMGGNDQIACQRVMILGLDVFDMDTVCLYQCFSNLPVVSEGCLSDSINACGVSSFLG